MAERLTPEEVIHVARLAHLNLSADEVALFAQQLGAVLEHAADIEALDVGDVKPTSHPLRLANVTRPDEIVASLPTQDVIALAPQSQDNMFVVPPLLGEPL